ncbi:MAG: LppX_LprAFG lipoprotein [Nocardioides sp.]
MFRRALRHDPRSTTLRAAAPLAIAALTLALVGSGCTGQKDEKGISEDKSPDEVMALAKKTLDDTSGVKIDLDTTDLPDGIQGISHAEGTGIHPPAFEGQLTAEVSGLSVDVDVIATDGKVWIKYLTPTFTEADPADYGAPDPAELMSTDGGLSDLLVNTDNLEAGDTVRGGENNEEVLTEYTGTVPATFVETVIPSASGDDFDATYTITADGELREAKLTGEFYPDGGPNTYTIKFSDYGTEKDISAP